MPKTIYDSIQKSNDIKCPVYGIKNGEVRYDQVEQKWYIYTDKPKYNSENDACYLSNYEIRYPVYDDFKIGVDYRLKDIDRLLKAHIGGCNK